MSPEVSLRDYMETRFSALTDHIDNLIKSAIASAEFGDRQNAQAIDALSTAVTANSNTLQAHSRRIGVLEAAGQAESVRRRTLALVASGSFTVGMGVVPLILKLAG